MPFITVNQGGSDLPDGVYSVTLVEISEPKTVTAQRGPKAGQDINLLDWTFAVDDGSQFDGETIQASTSMASGPKSKMYSWLTALLGGIPPAIGQSFERTDLTGRRALATIRKDESGWPRLENLGAIPAAMLAPAAPAAASRMAPSPAAAARQPF
jgi:hypothetical protein